MSEAADVVSLPGGVRFRPDWGTIEFKGGSIALRGQEAVVFAHMAQRLGKMVARDSFLDLLYGARPDGGPEYAREIVKIRICRIRQALRRLGCPLEVHTRHSYGYGLVAKQ